VADAPGSSVSFRPWWRMRGPSSSSVLYAGHGRLRWRIAPVPALVTDAPGSSVSFRPWWRMRGPSSSSVLYAGHGRHWWRIAPVPALVTDATGPPDLLADARPDEAHPSYKPAQVADSAVSGIGGGCDRGLRICGGCPLGRNLSLNLETSGSGRSRLRQGLRPGLAG